MRTPLFWYEPPGVQSWTLAPLGKIYASATARRLKAGARARIGIPVICVGNLTAGGTGKTPTVIALAERLRERGVSAHAVTRGYGGSEEGPVLVDPRADTAERVGDEALLLAAFLPTWVAKDRAVGARAAVAEGAEIVLLDDGFQNPSLGYDLSILVVDAIRGFGNGHVIPAGPLREPVDIGLARADLLLSIGPDKAQDEFAKKWGAALAIPHVTAKLDPLQTGLPIKGVPVVAFAGIGHPEKFFLTLKAMGAEVKAAHGLADHQPLTEALMTRILREASQIGAQVVTTEKDAVRLPSKLRAQVMTVPVRLQPSDWSALDAALDKIAPHPDL